MTRRQLKQFNIELLLQWCQKILLETFTVANYLCHHPVITILLTLSKKMRAQLLPVLQFCMAHQWQITSTMFCRARRIGHSIEVKRRGVVNRWEEIGLQLERLVLNNIPKFHIATWDMWEDHVFQGRSGFPK